MGVRLMLVFLVDALVLQLLWHCLPTSIISVILHWLSYCLSWCLQLKC